MNSHSTRSLRLLIFLIALLSAFLATAPHPRNVSLAFKITRLAIEAEAYPAAVVRLEQLAEFHPWRNDFLQQAGELAWKNGNAEDAISFYTHAVEQSALPPKSLLVLGDAYLATGDTDMAVKTWEQLAALPEYSEAILLRFLDLHRTTADYPLMIHDLRSLLRLHPNDANYYYQLGLLLAVLDPDASLAYLSQAAQNDSRLAENASTLIARINTSRLYTEPAYTSINVGRWMASVGEWQLAHLAFQQAVEQRADFPEAWAYLGEALQHISKTQSDPHGKAGLAELQTALKLDPDSIPALLLISIYWQRQGDEETALEYLSHAVEVEPDDPMLQAEMGRVTAKLGDLPAAQTFYEKAVALAPTNPLYWRLLARFSLDRHIQVRQLALPAARNAVLLAPHDPHYLDLLGETLLTLGDLLNAERFLQRSISIDSSIAIAHLHLGMVYLAQGKSELAQAELRLAKELAPSSTTSQHVERINSVVFP